MILHFKELGVNPMVYNGIMHGVARAGIINRTCDYCMQEYFPGLEELDCLFNVTEWEVNFLLHTVTVQCAPIVYKPFH